MRQGVWYGGGGYHRRRRAAVRARRSVYPPHIRTSRTSRHSYRSDDTARACIGTAPVRPACPRVVLQRTGNNSV
jgi:hypothetical protein